MWEYMLPQGSGPSRGGLDEVPALAVTDRPTCVVKGELWDVPMSRTWAGKGGGSQVHGGLVPG